MAKLDKLKKKIKQLKRKLDRQFDLPKKTKKEIKYLKRELELRNQVIVDLKCQLAEQQNATPELANALLLAETEDKKAVIDHKNAWKRHTFLRDRYEHHMGSGYEKDKARTMANKDLIDRYGTEVGFTAEQLCDILS